MEKEEIRQKIYELVEKSIGKKKLNLLISRRPYLLKQALQGMK